MIARGNKALPLVIEQIKLALMMLLLAIATPTQSAAPKVEQLLAENPGKALVLLYREDKLAASAIHYRPYLNDVPMAVMPNGTWSSAMVPPGNYDLWLEQYAPKGHPKGVRSRAVANYDWQSGQVYFLKVDSVSMPGLVSRAQAEVMQRKRAEADLDELVSAGETLLYPPVGSE